MENNNESIKLPASNQQDFFYKEMSTTYFNATLMELIYLRSETIILISNLAMGILSGGAFVLWASRNNIYEILIPISLALQFTTSFLSQFLSYKKTDQFLLLSKELNSLFYEYEEYWNRNISYYNDELTNNDILDKLYELKKKYLELENKYDIYIMHSFIFKNLKDTATERMLIYCEKFNFGGEQ